MGPRSSELPNSSLLPASSILLPSCSAKFASSDILTFASPTPRFFSAGRKKRGRDSFRLWRRCAGRNDALLASTMTAGVSVMLLSVL